MQAGAVNIRLMADIADLQNKLRQAEQLVGGGAGKMGQALAGLKSIAAAAFAAVAAGAAIAGAALGAMVHETMTTAVDIERMAAMAGSSNKDFQIMAAGAKSVGLEMDKFSDIAKDVQDKMGDYFVTGGGELADFFDSIAPKVGVTAKQFKHLSGPEAMQLFYSTLEKAGVGQAVMIQQMESLASDSSTLAPLLANNGEGFKLMGDQAQRAGAIMSDDLIYASKALNIELAGIKTLMTGVATEISAAVIPMLLGMAQTARAELASGFEAVSTWVADNRVQVLGVWEATKALAVQVWGLLEPIAGVAVGIGKWMIESGAVQVVLESVGLMVAGLKDGVTVLGAAFAGVGSVILRMILSPLKWYLTAISKVQGFLGNDDSAAAFASAAASIKSFSEAGGQYAAGVVAQFARGESAVAKFKATMGQTTAATLIDVRKTRDALSGVGTGAGLISTKAAAEAKKAAEDAAKKAGAALGKSAAAAQKAIDEAAKLAAAGLDLANSLTAQNGGLSGDFEKKWDSLGAAYKSGSINLDLLTSSQAALLAQQPAMKEAQDVLSKAAEAAAQSLKSVADRVTGLQDEAAALDLSRAQNVSLAEAVEMLAIARMEEAQAAKFYEGSEGWQALQREIDARKELLGLMSTKAVREKEEAGWADIWKSVDGTAHDVFVNIFDGGQDAFTKLRDTLKATLLDLLYQMTVKKWIVNIGASVTGGMSGAASAATSSGSGMPSLASMSNLLGGANPLTEFGMASTNAFYSLGGMATNAGFTSLGSTITANATAMGNFASVAGDALGYLNSIKAIADGQYGAGIGGAIGTYFGGPIGSFIGSKIGGMIDSAVAGETRSGATYDTGADGKAHLQQGPSGGEIAADSARAMFTAAQDSINATLKAVGSSATLTGYTAGLESSKNGKGFEFAGGYVGGKSFGENLGRDGRQFAMHSQDSQAAFTAYGLQLSQSIVEALQAAGDIPDTIKNVIDGTLKGASASTLSSEAVTALLNTINAVVVSVKGFNAVVKTLPFENLKGLGFDAAAGLIAAAGGMDALGSSLTGYYDNFYSDEEKRLQTIKNINAATAGSGLDAATATRASYRALVEAQDVTTESGRKTYLALMGASSAFASITPAADAAGEAVDDLSSKMRDAAQAALTTAADDLAKAREAELSVMQETASGLQASIDKFRDFSKSIRDFRDGLKLSALSPLTPAQRYAEAQKQFDVAQKSGDSGQLQSASTALLEASRVYNASSGVYTSDFDRVQSALTLAANQASATADVAQLQLTAAQSQLDALGSIDEGVLSVAEAMTALSSAVLAAVAAGVNPGTENIASLTGGVQNEWVGSAYSSSAGAGAVNTGSGISISTPDGRMFTGMDAVNAVNSMLSAGNTRGVYDSAKDAGISLASLDQLMGWKPMEAEDWAKANGLPLFERGTNYVGADTLAYLHQGEAVVPRAYNPAADGRQARDDGALLAEIRLMRQENNLLRDELRQLRQQQSVETGAVIAATHAASARNAETISSKQSRAAWSKSPELA